MERSRGSAARRDIWVNGVSDYPRNLYVGPTCLSFPTHDVSSQTNEHGLKVSRHFCFVSLLYFKSFLVWYVKQMEFTMYRFRYKYCICRNSHLIL